MLHPTSPRFSAAVVFVVAVLGLVGFGARPAAGAEWTVKPADNTFGAGREDYRYTINPGGRLEDAIVVVNHGVTALRLALHGADGFTTRTGRLDLVTNAGRSKGVGAWVLPDGGDVRVRPGESVDVPFAIELPDDAAPGDHVGGIVASLTQAGVKRRAGIPIRLRVGGALKPGLSVERLRVDYADTASPIGTGDATVAYTIHNTGNAVLAARQAVSVSGPFGRWAVSAGRIADTPPLLPGETWKVSAPLQDVAPSLRLTATVTLVPLLTDAAGSTAPLATIKASGHALTVPWALLVAITGLSGLVVAGLALRPRRRHRAPLELSG